MKNLFRSKRSKTGESSSSQREEQQFSPPPPNQPRKAQGSTSSGSMGCKLTPSQSKIFGKIRDRVLLPTKFVDQDALHSLGLFHGIHTLLERRGLHGFMDVAADVYPRLTLEFL